MVKKSQAGGGVAVKIEHAVYESAKMFGRHFDEKDEIYSKISRQSIDVLKVRDPACLLSRSLLTMLQASFKAEVSNEEWLLIKALKPVSIDHPCYEYVTLTWSHSASASHKLLVCPHVSLYVSRASCSRGWNGLLESAMHHATSVYISTSHLYQ